MCPFCGDDVALFEVSYGPENEVEPLLCCEELRDICATEPSLLRQLLWKEAGQPVREVVKAPLALVADWGLDLRPVPQKIAKVFVTEHHRHNEAPLGWKWGFGIYNGQFLVGVCTVGRPTGRGFNGRPIIEVNRLCLRTDVPPALTRHACSKAYGAAAREAKRRGYERIVTYILDSEPGTSLRAAGWIDRDPRTGKLNRVKGRSRNQGKRPREDKAPTCDKIRWEKWFT